MKQYVWFYLIVLNLLLIVFYLDSYYPNELTTLAWAVSGTIGYSMLVMLLVNKKRKKERDRLHVRRNRRAEVHQT